jgi:hypothetical protein
LFQFWTTGVLGALAPISRPGSRAKKTKSDEIGLFSGGKKMKMVSFFAASLVLGAVSSAASAADPGPPAAPTPSLTVEKMVREFTEGMKNALGDKADRSDIDALKAEVKKEVSQCLATCQTPAQVRNVRSKVRRTVRRTVKRIKGLSPKDMGWLLSQLDSLFDRLSSRFDKLGGDHDQLLKGQGEIKQAIDRNGRKIDEIKRAIQRAGGECEAGLKVLSELDEDTQTLVAREVAKAYPACKGALVLNRTNVVTLCIQHGGETFMSPNGTFVCERPKSSSAVRNSLTNVVDVKPAKSGSGAAAAFKIVGFGLGLALAGGAIGCGAAAASSPSGEQPDGSFRANACWKGGGIGLGVGLAVGLATGSIWAAADGDL